MATVIGKEQLCSTDLKHFKALQGIDGKTLFDRYKLAESSIINRYIDPKYRDFLAYPVKEGDIITFHSKTYNETPRILSDLQGDDLTKYQNIKAETLAHFNKEIDSLKKSDKTTEAEFLAAATKHVDDRFVYCYDDKVVLGVWGMQLRDNVRADVNEIRKNLATKIKGGAHNADPLQPEPELEPPVDVPQPEPQPEEPPVNNLFIVRFNAGEGGILNGILECTKYNGDTVKETEVPQVKTKGGYEFTGWDKNPNNYAVTGNTEFTAQYRETIVMPIIPWWKGCLNWLLLLLLLSLICMMLWCCLLKNCSFNFCGCGCDENTEIVIPDPKPAPVPMPPTPIKPVKTFKGIKIETTDAGADDIGKILKMLGIKHKPFSGKFECDILFINCTKSDKVLAKAPMLKKYVENGGIVYASDLAVDVIHASFRNTLETIVSDRHNIIKATVADSELRKYLGDTISVNLAGTSLRIAGMKDTVKVLISGNYNNRPVMVEFPVGKGKVYYTTFHNSSQANNNEKKLLQLLVLKQIAFLNDMTIQEVADSNDVDLNNLKYK